MELADQADAFRLRGLETRAIPVYRRALAQAEAAVWLSTRDGAGVRTLSILYRSAVLLAMDCNEWRKAENLIQQGIENLPSTSLQKELKDLLKRLPLPVEASVIDLPDTESNGASTFPPDVEIKAALRGDNDLTFDGPFDREIVSASQLTLGTSANIHGDVRARSPNFSGSVQRKVFVGGTRKLLPSAVLMGVLKATHMILEKGASFIGNSPVGPMQPPARAVGNQRKSPQETNSIPAEPAKPQDAKGSRKRKKRTANGSASASYGATGSEA
jgi:cytoskeletal protein CcmA (bactofilin family)